MLKYLILNKDIIVATIDDNTITIINSKLCPLRFHRCSDFIGWLETRYMDKSRVNSRILKKSLHFKSNDIINNTMFINATSITDSYWVKEVNSTLQYKDVKQYYDNKYFNTALLGDINNLSTEPTPTPEISNIGSYEKGWKYEDDKWNLYKKGTIYEVFSELFTYNLAKLLNRPIAEYYKVDNNTIKTLDYTNNASVNYDPMEGLVDDNEDYEFNISKLKRSDLVKQYLDILFMDTIVINADRHTSNYGVLRDVDTGDIISMAPNFDNNLSLVSFSIPNSLERNDILVKYFNEISLPSNYQIPLLSEEIILKAIYLTDVKVDVDNSVIVSLCMNAYNRVVNSELSTNPYK